MAEHDGRAERRAKKPRSTASAPSIYSAWLESSISSYEALAKELVGHRAEKGRIVEGVVKAALRTVLPGKFSIGTGFAITASEIGLQAVLTAFAR